MVLGPTAAQTPTRLASIATTNPAETRLPSTDGSLHIALLLALTCRREVAKAPTLPRLRRREGWGRPLASERCISPRDDCSPSTSRHGRRTPATDDRSR